MSKKDFLLLNESKQFALNKPFKVLSEHVISYKELVAKYKGDKLYANELASLFLLRNRKALGFLGIEEGVSSESGIRLITSRYVGCVPLVSPKTGLPGGFIQVVGNFGEDISELLSVIDGTIEPEYDESLRVYQDSFVKPPLYFECMKYIDQYVEAKKYNWRRFTNIEKIEHRPTSSTRWDKYALRSYDPAKTFNYPNKCNVLTREHPEWLELNYVLDFCINEVMSMRTPIRSKTAYLSKINNLSNSYDKRSIRAVKEVRIHKYDPIIIQSLKMSANKVLQNVSSINCAWRMDLALFFERYVQFVIQRVAFTKGARFSTNPKYPVNGRRPAWALKYIEPDMIIDKGNVQYIIDAKYKAHMMDLSKDSEYLKEKFREDLHQVLAYSSFGGNDNKNVMLVYPSSTEVIKRELTISSSINSYSCSVFLVGIPLRKSTHEETIKRLSEIITL